jgi:hypothetical protein
MAALRIWVWMMCCVLGVVNLQNHVMAVSVAYDQRALKLDGQRRMLISGSIHYPRSTSKVSKISPRLHIYHSCVICWSVEDIVVLPVVASLRIWKCCINWHCALHPYLHCEC